MNKPTLINQTSFIIDGLGFDISVFDFSDELNLSDILKIETLQADMQKELVKKDSANEYLKPLFILDRLDVKDFEKFKSKEELFQYLEAFADNDKWFEFNKVFKRSIIQFKSYFSSISANDAFLINKDWFTLESEKVREREFLCYGFYLLIIWFDLDKGKLYTCEWSDE